VAFRALHGESSTGVALLRHSQNFDTLTSLLSRTRERKKKGDRRMDYLFGHDSTQQEVEVTK